MNNTTHWAVWGISLFIPVCFGLRHLGWCQVVCQHFGPCHWTARAMASIPLRPPGLPAGLPAGLPVAPLTSQRRLKLGAFERHCPPFPSKKSPCALPVFFFIFFLRHIGLWSYLFRVDFAHSGDQWYFHNQRPAVRSGPNVPLARHSLESFGLRQRPRWRWRAEPRWGRGGDMWNGWVLGLLEWNCLNPKPS